MLKKYAHNLFAISVQSIVAVIVLISTSGVANAQTYSWTGATSTWETAANWGGAGYPNTSGQTAAFGATGNAIPTISTSINIDGINFQAGAQSYTVLVNTGGSLSFASTGVVNNSGIYQELNVFTTLSFNNSSTVSGSGSVVIRDNGVVNFNDTSSTGSASIVVQTDKQLNFSGNAVLSSAVNNSGTMVFQGASNATGGTISMTNATLDITGATSQVSVGNLIGSGSVLLGAKQLTVGALNQNGTLSAIISGSGGALVKTGIGTLTLTATNTYTGNTTVKSGALVVDGTGAITASGSNLVVGDVSGDNGTLVVQNGGQIAASNSYIGNNSGSVGTVTVTGIGSQISGTTHVGSSGTGTLTVSNGGSVGALIVGDNSTGIGTVTIDGPGSRINSTSPTDVGLSGKGTLTISGGATGTGLALAIGINPGSSGTVTVTGAGSSWQSTTTSNALTVGTSGSGTLTISDGGLVTVGIGGTGAARVGGSHAGSTLNIGNFDLTHATTSGTLQAASVLLNTGAVLNFNQTDSDTFAPTITGNGSVVQRGTGTTILTGANSYSGGTVISAGVLQANTDTALGSGAVTVDSGATLSLYDNAPEANTANNITISGTGATSNSGAINASGGGFLRNITGNVSLAGNALITNNGTNLALNLSAINLGSSTLTLGTGFDSINLTGNISGSGGLVINTANAQIDGGQNTFTGTTEVLSGKNLQLGDQNGTAISGNLIIDGGGFVADELSNQLSANTVITFNGSSIYQFDNSGTTQAETFAGLSGTSTSSNLRISNLSMQTGQATVTLTGTGFYSYAGQITDSGASVIPSYVSLVKTGSGTQVLSGNNNYAGGTTISRGILEADGSNTALGTGDVTVQSGGELFLNNNIALANNITITGTGATSNSGAIGSGGSGVTSETITGTVSLAGNALVRNNAGNTDLQLSAVNLGSNTLTVGAGGFDFISFNGNITGSGGLIINTYNASIVGGQNTFTGTTDVLYGDGLNLRDLDGIAISGNLSIEGAVLDRASNQLSANTIITLNGGAYIFNNQGTTQAETIAGLSGTATNSNLTIQNLSFSSGQATVTLSGTGFYSYAGQITETDAVGDATLSLVKAGSGTQVLSGNNTYHGGTQLNGGTLSVSADNNLGAVSGTLAFNGGILETTAGFSTARAVTLTGAGTFQTDTGTLTLTTGITGTGSLSKTGAETLQLTGTSTYSGGTTVHFGTLAVSGTGASIGTSSSNLNVGDNSGDDGALTITNGGQVSASTVEVAASGAAKGTINLDSGGVLQTGQVVNGAGTGGTVLNFDGGILRASGVSTDLISNFTGTQITLLSGGGTIDNNGYNITINAPFSGSGGLTFTGMATTIMAGASSYSGGTTITNGAIEATNDSALGTGGLTINPSGTLIVNTSGLSVGDLSGAGTINLLSNSGFGINTTGTNTFSGTLEGNPAATTPFALPTFAEIGGGTLKMTGTTTLYGQIAAFGGTIEFDSPASLSNNTFLLVASGANIVVNGVDLKTAGLGTLGPDSDGDVILNGGSLTVELPTGVSSTSDSFGGNISGSGGFGINGAGITQTLSGTNTYSGVTTITAGTLVAGSTTALSVNSDFSVNGTLDLNGFSNGIASLSGTGTVTNGGATNVTLTVGGTNSVTATTFAGLIKDGATGTTALNLAGGQLTLSGSNTYSGGTTLQNGTLVLGNSSALGTGALITMDPTVVYTNGVNIANAVIMEADTTLEVDDTDSATQTGAISESGGSDGVIKTGAGTLVLDGVNTYTGVTTINAGTLTLEAGSSIASSSGVNLAASSTTLDISAGNQTIQDLNGVAGSTVNLGAKALTFGTTNPSSFSGTIQGAGGSLIKQGLGNMTLSGANTFSGGTTINAGTLTIANPTALGTGDVTNNGTLMTDGINHLIIVGGNYTQGAGGTLQLSISNATTFDTVQLHGAGVAHLNGTLALNLNGSFAPGAGQEFALITTNNPIDGKFSSVTTNLPSIGGVINYTNNVTLLYQKSFNNLAGLNLTPNQSAIATYLDTYDQHITNPAFANLIGALNNASGTPATLQSAINQLSPLNFANFTSSTAFNNTSFLMGQLDGYLSSHRGPDGKFVSSDGGIDYSGLAINNPNIDSSLQGIRSRLLAWSPAPNAGLLSDSGNLLMGGMDMKDVVVPSEPMNLWNVFITGNVVLAQNFSDPSAGLPYNSSTTGAAQIGADYKITPHWLVGATFGYGHTNATLDSIGSNANVNTYSPGVYTSYANKGWYVNGIGSYGFGSYSQNRNVSIGAFNGTAHSSPGGDQITGDIDGGYDFHRGNWTFGPTLGVQYTHLTVNGYTETGLPGADLTVNQNDSDSLRSRLGGQVSYTIKTASLIFTPHLSASWQHEFMDQSRGITSQFSDVGAGSFVVSTPNPSRESALADVGLDSQINNTLTVFTDYSVQAGQSNYFGQSVQAGVKIGF